MYEFRLGGWWFRWSALDRRSKWLCGGSLATAGLAVLPLGHRGRALGRAVGDALGSGESLFAVYDGLPVWMALWTFVFALSSGVLWWRLSRRQDELFNRVQNWVLGTAGAWTALLTCIWGLTNMMGLAPPIQAPAPLLLFTVMIGLLFPVAVRKWAS